MPNANLGPDLSLRVLCGQSAIGGIASVSEEGPGATSWTVTLVGDSAFTVDQRSLVTCQAGGTTVATVSLQAPPDALPGATYDAVATIRAEGDAFPPGTVKLHGEVVAPSVTVAPTLDFGDVPAGKTVVQPIHFIENDTNPVFYNPDFVQGGPFITSTSQRTTDTTTDWFIELMASPPGDYSLDTTWTASPLPNLGFQDACFTKKMVTLRAHVVGVDGGADGPDGADGGFDGSTLPLIIP
jgi:hypothetical protein